MNLRCPHCKFIAELDRFTTGEERQYMYATTQNLALRTREGLLEDTFGDISGSSSDHVELEVTGGDVDFGRVDIIPSIFQTLPISFDSRHVQRLSLIETYYIICYVSLQKPPAHTDRPGEEFAANSVSILLVGRDFKGSIWGF